jgi:hypothetical protein
VTANEPSCVVVYPVIFLIVADFTHRFLAVLRELNNPRLEAERFCMRRLEVDFLFSVIPAEAGIQAAL